MNAHSKNMQNKTIQNLSVQNLLIAKNVIVTNIFLCHKFFLAVIIEKLVTFNTAYYLNCLLESNQSNCFLNLLSHLHEQNHSCPNLKLLEECTKMIN